MPFDKDPVVPDTKDTETQSDIDLSAAEADISSSLFGQGNDEDKGKDDNAEIAPTEGEEPPAGENAVADEAPPQPAEEGKTPEEAADNSSEVQELGAPKTWTKAALEKWATVDPVVKAEIAKREEDFLNGITQYKDAADVGLAYSKVVEPYAPMLAAENVDPVQMFQSFASNHYLLSRGTPEQKIQLAAGLINGYNIPLGDLLDYIADGGTAPAQQDPAFLALRKELDDLKGTITSAQTAEQTRQQEVIAKEVDAFAADPAHPHFDELANDIHKLFGAGLATSLQEAYDKALYANPTTRQAEIDRLTAERTSANQSEEAKRKDKILKSTADRVDSIPKVRDGTVPVGSIDDTLAETMAAIEGRS